MDRCGSKLKMLADVQSLEESNFLRLVVFILIKLKLVKVWERNFLFFSWQMIDEKYFEGSK